MALKKIKASNKIWVIALEIMAQSVMVHKMTFDRD